MDKEKTQNENIQKEKTQSKGMTIFKSILNTVINILIVLVLITSILIAVLALTSKSSGVSTIFGYTIQTIQSDSMKGGSPDGYPEGDFSHGDLMIAKATGSDPEAKYNVGDIATYKTMDTDGQDVLIVHRIVDAVENSDGSYSYQTWGDNREVSEVPDQLSREMFLTSSAFVSVYYTAGYKGVILKGVGNVLDFLRSQQGFFLVVLLPMVLFFMYELVRVVLNFTNYRKAKNDEDKEKAVAEALSKRDADKPENMSAEQMEQFKQFLEFQKQQQAQQQADQNSPEPPDQA